MAITKVWITEDCVACASSTNNCPEVFVFEPENEGSDTGRAKWRYVTTGLENDRFVEIVKDIIKRTGTDASRLELELTETTILKSPEKIKSRMDELRLLGVSFSLDDFGTGYSSFTHLLELPIDVLKLDRKLIANIDREARNQALVAGIIEMAQRLEMKVVAEGVEREEEYLLLQSLGCDQIQGFWIAKPLDQQQLLKFLGGWPEPAKLKGSSRIHH